jgi:uncharacterized protein YxjI
MNNAAAVFNTSTLIVSQKAKLIEINNQYTVSNDQGQVLATVNQVGQSKAKKVLRLVSNLDQYMTHKLEIAEPNGDVIMRLTRPRKIIKSTVIVADANDNEIGRIVQENMIGKIHFAMEVNGQKVGSIRAESWLAWDFRIEDASGNEIARIDKTWAGALTELFTTADNYAVSIKTTIEQPLLSLVVAAALSVDTALKQDSN